MKAGQNWISAFVHVCLFKTKMIQFFCYSRNLFGVYGSGIWVFVSSFQFCVQDLKSTFQINLNEIFVCYTTVCPMQSKQWKHVDLVNLETETNLKLELSLAKVVNQSAFYAGKTRKASELFREMLVNLAHLFQVFPPKFYFVVFATNSDLHLGFRNAYFCSTSYSPYVYADNLIFTY